MQVVVLMTNGGAHPPDKWARMTAFMIVNHIIPKQIEVGGRLHDLESSAEPKVAALRKARDALEVVVRDIVEAAHEKVQAGERAAVASGGADRLGALERDAAVAEHVSVDDVVRAVTQVASLHPDLLAHFSRDDVRAEVAERLRMDFASVMDIERSLFADRVAADPAHLAFARVREWRVTRHPGPHPSVGAA